MCSVKSLIVTTALHCTVHVHTDGLITHKNLVCVVQPPQVQGRYALLEECCGFTPRCVTTYFFNLPGPVLDHCMTQSVANTTHMDALHQCHDHPIIQEASSGPIMHACP